MDEQAPVGLLWTSGWDSTFRLLGLLLERRRPVAPVYLLDDTRASAATEIATMQRIRDALAEAFPHTRALLLPTTIVPVADLAPDAAIEQAFRRLSARHGIGSQYAWLARYRKQHGRAGLELSTECIRLGASGLIVDRAVPTRAPCGDPSFHLPADCVDRDIARLFGGFLFPLIETTRTQMVAQAQSKDWNRFMHMTWFCHRPTLRGRPCGLCNPCRAVIEEGFAWRVPRDRRALYAVYRVTWLPVRIRARRWWLGLRARHAAATP